MSTINKLIHELTIFYVKTNYDNYLKINNLDFISDDKIPSVVDELCNNDKKEHLKQFIINSLNELLKDECPDRLVLKQILNDGLSDDELCKEKLILEIKIYQKKIKENKD
jgi:hypothetical protein